MHFMSFTVPPLALFALTASAGQAAISNYELGNCQNFWFATELSAAADTSSYYDTPGAYESSKVTAVDAGCSVMAWDNTGYTTGGRGVSVGECNTGIVAYSLEC